MYFINFMLQLCDTSTQQMLWDPKSRQNRRKLYKLRPDEPFCKRALLALKWPAKPAHMHSRSGFKFQNCVVKFIGDDQGVLMLCHSEFKAQNNESVFMEDNQGLLILRHHVFNVQNMCPCFGATASCNMQIYIWSSFVVERQFAFADNSVCWW